MANEIGYKSEEREDGRVLFTGNGDRMIESIIDLVPSAYQKEKCAPTDTDLDRALKAFRPHVAVISLLNETREMLRVYDLFYNYPEYKNIPVIAVGREDDCLQFKSKLPIKHMELFVRPLDREGFLATLKEFTALSQAAEEAESEKAQPKQKAQEQEEDGGILDEPLESEKALVRKIELLSRIHGRKSVLVVDDDVRMLNVIKLYLQDLYDVTVVPSGKLAIKYISKKNTDLVLLDYMMPELDGPDVLQQIREGDSNAEVPVIFLTGVSDRESVMRGLEFRPNGYLLKPVNRETLLEKVTEVVLGL